MATQQPFDELEKTALSDLRDDAWNAYYAAMSPWLCNADADIRKRAINRLCAAVLWAQPRAVEQARKAQGALSVGLGETERLPWLLDTLDAAHAQYQDIIPMALAQLEFQDGYDPAAPLTQWLERLRAAPPPGVDPNVLDGVILQRQGLDEDDTADVARVVALLDHPSNYVRACAARMLSAADGDALDAAAMFALIREKEIIRPGIAGAYWTDWGFCRNSLPVDPVIWMMDILLHRSGPEPQDMPFNGIDFHAHEICAYTPSAVLQMIEAGHLDIAINTATETLAVVPGMEPILRQLAEHADPHVRNRARFQLGIFYRFVHPDDNSGLIRRWPDWAPEAELFSFHHGAQRALWFVVLYPGNVGDFFSDATAWLLIDKALPPALRGAVVLHHLDYAKPTPPTPYRLGDMLMWQFSSGALVELQGDPDEKCWRRVMIMANKLGAQWQPIRA